MRRPGETPGLAFQALAQADQRNAEVFNRFHEAMQSYLKTRPDRLRFLLVEDDGQTAKSYQRLLGKEFGAEVVAVGSGEEGLALLRREVFDVVFVDLNLPGMPGWRVVEELRRESLRPLASVIVMSGEAEDELKAIAARCGANLALAKPADSEEVFGAIRHLLELDFL